MTLLLALLFAAFLAWTIAEEIMRHE